MYAVPGKDRNLLEEDGRLLGNNSAEWMIPTWRHSRKAAMEKADKQIEIINADRFDKIHVIVVFSDGTIATFTVEQLT